jgi:hypothetical protein
MKQQDVRHDNYLKSVFIAYFRHLKNYKVAELDLYRKQKKEELAKIISDSM